MTESLRKRTVACDLCRARKVRCNGEKPCDVCSARGEHCRTSPRAKKRASKATDKLLHERLRRLEVLVQPSSSEGAGRRSQHHVSPPLSAAVPSLSASPNAYDAGPVPAISTCPAYIIDAPASRTRCATATLAHPTAEDDRGILSVDEASLKYHGPHSGLSMCTKPAIQWISWKLVNDKYQPAATRFVRTVRGMFGLQAPLSKERKPDPPVEEAWQYVEAYFAEAPETPFGVVRRDLFQPMLEAHFAGFGKDESPAFYALRNCILASGCRIKNAPILGFCKAVEMASGWFENAMSVHTELLYMPTTIIGVAALVVMAYFADGIGGPLLQPMLSACAIRLACSKGLHCEPSSSWDIDEVTKRHARGIFWAIYCIDQSNAASAGRPPAINEETISCKPPEMEWTSETSTGWYCMAMVKLEQLHGQVGRTIHSGICRKDLEAFLAALKTLTDRTEALKAQLKPTIDLEEAFDSSRLPSGRVRIMTLCVVYKYYELLFRIHSSLVYPWIRPAWKEPLPESVHQAVQESAAILAWVSRQVLIGTTAVPLDPNCRSWMATLVPLMACNDSFLRIIDDPRKASVPSDLALLELGVAHFARLELYSEGHYSIPFARELAQLASDLRGRVSSDASSHASDVSSTPGLTTQALTMQNLPNTKPFMRMDIPPTSTSDLLDMDWLNDEFDPWDFAATYNI